MSIQKRTGNEIPRPTLGKTHRSNRWVRFVDLNDYTDKIVDFSNSTFLPAPQNPQDGDALVYNSTSGNWEAGSAGGGVQNGYELLTEFDYQMFNSNVDEPSFLILNIPLPSVSHFIEHAVLVEVSPLDVDSLLDVSIKNSVTGGSLASFGDIGKLNLSGISGAPQGSTVDLEFRPSFVDPIVGGNTQGEYKVFVKYGQIPN